MAAAALPMPAACEDGALPPMPKNEPMLDSARPNTSPRLCVLP